MPQNLAVLSGATSLGVLPRRSCWTSAPQPWGHKPRRTHTHLHAYKLTYAGQEIEVDKDAFLIGSGQDCDMKLPASSKVAPQHARLTRKGPGVLCTALVGEETWDSSSTWLDGQELRPGVGYLVGTGNVMAFGEPSQQVTISFNQGSGKSPLMEMLMQGMAGNASDEVRKQLNR